MAIEYKINQKSHLRILVDRSLMCSDLLRC